MGGKQQKVCMQVEVCCVVAVAARHALLLSLQCSLLALLNPDYTYVPPNCEHVCVFSVALHRCCHSHSTCKAACESLETSPSVFSLLQNLIIRPSNSQAQSCED